MLCMCLPYILLTKVRNWNAIKHPIYLKSMTPCMTPTRLIGIRSTRLGHISPLWPELSLSIYGKLNHVSHNMTHEILPQYYLFLVLKYMLTFQISDRYDCLMGLAVCLYLCQIIPNRVKTTVISVIRVVGWLTYEKRFAIGVKKFRYLHN